MGGVVLVPLVSQSHSVVVLGFAGREPVRPRVPAGCAAVRWQWRCCGEMAVAVCCGEMAVAVLAVAVCWCGVVWCCVCGVVWCGVV